MAVVVVVVVILLYCSLVTLFTMKTNAAIRIVAKLHALRICVQCACMHFGVHLLTQIILVAYAFCYVWMVIFACLFRYHYAWDIDMDDDDGDDDEWWCPVWFPLQVGAGEFLPSDDRQMSILHLVIGIGSAAVCLFDFQSVWKQSVMFVYPFDRAIFHVRYAWLDGICDSDFMKRSHDLSSS